MTGAFWAMAGVVSTLAIFLAGVIFHAGHVSARVQELERWRVSIRDDMHEISEKIGALDGSIRALVTVVEERTERRQNGRGVDVIRT